MKAIQIIEDAIKEVNLIKLPPSETKHKKMALGHLQKAIVQIQIGERKRKIVEDRKKKESEKNE